jgi:hypothetical protein
MFLYALTQNVMSTFLITVENDKTFNVVFIIAIIYYSEAVCKKYGRDGMPIVFL